MNKNVHKCKHKFITFQCKVLINDLQHGCEFHIVVRQRRCIINIALRQLFLPRLLEGTSEFWDWG